LPVCSETIVFGIGEKIKGYFSKCIPKDTYLLPAAGLPLIFIRKDGILNPSQKKNKNDTKIEEWI